MHITAPTNKKMNIDSIPPPPFYIITHQVKFNYSLQTSYSIRNNIKYASSNSGVYKVNDHVHIAPLTEGTVTLWSIKIAPTKVRGLLSSQKSTSSKT